MAAVAVMAAVLFAASLVDADTSCYTPQQWNRTCGPRAYNLPSKLFGTKTTYAHATGLNSKKSREIYFKGCKPLLLLLFMRHTTRYPNKKDIRKFGEMLPQLRDHIVQAFDNGSGYMCSKHISWLKVWKPQWNESDENQVTKSGIKETEKIADRLQEMFPELLPKKFSEHYYSVTATTRVRSQDTAHAFLKEILRDDEYKRFRRNRHAMRLDDRLLSFNSVCEKLLEKQGVREPESEEEKKFLNSTHVRAMVEAVSNRTGVNVSIEDVKLMAKVCAFEVAHNGWSPFCHLFDGQDLELLEYAGDLEDYEEDAYRDERDAASACVLIEEIVDKIRAKLEVFVGRKHRHRHLKASLYFTHAGPMKRLFARLGLGKGETPLRAEDYCERGRERSWRSSRMVPFTANFALVLFQCDLDDFYVLLMLNERIIRLPGCGRSLLCPLSNFMRIYAPRGTEKCDLDRICSKDWKPNRMSE